MTSPRPYISRCYISHQKYPYYHRIASASLCHHRRRHRSGYQRGNILRFNNIYGDVFQNRVGTCSLARTHTHHPCPRSVIPFRTKNNNDSSALEPVDQLQSSSSRTAGLNVDNVPCLPHQGPCSGPIPKQRWNQVLCKFAVQACSGGSFEAKSLGPVDDVRHTIVTVMIMMIVSDLIRTMGGFTGKIEFCAVGDVSGAEVWIFLGAQEFPSFSNVPCNLHNSAIV